MIAKLNKFYNKVCLKTAEVMLNNSNKLMFLAGAGLLFSGMNEMANAVPAGLGPQVAGAFSYQACGFLLGYIEGGFGALIAAGAGIGAIVASALGGFKAAWTLVVVSVGAFILRSYITLFNIGCPVNG